MDKNKLLKFSKAVYHLAASAVVLMGLMLLLLLSAWSIVFLKTGSLDKAILDLRPFIERDTAYIYLGILTVFAVGSVIKLIDDIYKGIKKARDPSLSAEEKGGNLFWWLIKN